MVRFKPKISPARSPSAMATKRHSREITAVRCSRRYAVHDACDAVKRGPLTEVMRRTEHGAPKLLGQAREVGSSASASFALAKDRRTPAFAARTPPNHRARRLNEGPAPRSRPHDRSPHERAPRGKRPVASQTQSPKAPRRCAQRCPSESLRDAVDCACESRLAVAAPA